MRRELKGKVYEHECDGCGKMFLQLEGDELPYGYHGNAIEVNNAGGRGDQWFAHTQRCIRKAVLKAVWRNGRSDEQAEEQG